VNELCAERESCTVGKTARCGPDHIRPGRHAPGMTRMLEMIEDRGTVGATVLPCACVHDGGARARNRATSRFTAATAASISLSVVNRPRLKRSELCAN